MKDFLDGCKNTFFMESDLVNESEITSIVENNLIPKPIDLPYYAQNNIPDYQNITEIPQENLDYLNSGLVAGNMNHMFSNCTNLQSFPKLNIDTTHVSDMSYMFYVNMRLGELNLSNLNTSNVTNMSYMFYNSSSLTTIKGIIDMKSCTNFYNMFEGSFLPLRYLKGVQIKNPPEGFDGAGLSSDQYEIVS